MPRSFTFEKFGGADEYASTVFLPDGQLRQIKSDALQAGHDLGYAKALEECRALEAEALRDIGSKLQDITFTHFEARKAVLTSLEGVIDAMIDVILPDIAKEALAEIVSTQMLALASLMNEGPIRLICAPDIQPLIEQALTSFHQQPIAAVAIADPASSGLQIRIESPVGERQIDLDTAIANIRDAVAGFYQLAQEVKNHG